MGALSGRRAAADRRRLRRAKASARSPSGTAARKDRIGEHAAGHALSWAVNALGPVPADPADRRDWQQRASSIGAYRELSGHDHPADPIGPEPRHRRPRHSRGLA